jgi:hypothetical protein
MKLSDGSDLGISTETIARPGHTLGLCPDGMIWFKVIRVAITGEYDLRQLRQYWIQAQLPRDLEEVKQHLALVRRKDGRVSWMFLYLSELTPDHLGWFTDQDWENVRAWLSSARMRQVLCDALELCRQQHETNVKVASPVLAVDELTDFPLKLDGCQPCQPDESPLLEGKLMTNKVALPSDS